MAETNKAPLSPLGELYQKMIDEGLIIPSQEPPFFKMPSALKEIDSITTYSTCEEPIVGDK